MRLARAATSGSTRSSHFDPTRLPPQPCDAYDEWRAGLDRRGRDAGLPRGVHEQPVVDVRPHAAAHRRRPPGDAHATCSPTAANFSADTGDDGGVAFAFKGILGFYPAASRSARTTTSSSSTATGSSATSGSTSSRSTPTEIDLLLAHLWELRGVEFDYYFFDENCSYQLLALLDAARPDLDLQEQFRGWVIPADTVRAVVARARSGRRRRLPRRPPPRGCATRRASCRARRRRLASAIADGARRARRRGARRAARRRERAAVLGTAYELFRYPLPRPAARATPDEQRPRARASCWRAAACRSRARRSRPCRRRAVRPDQGHRSSRAAARHRRARRPVLPRGAHPARLSRPARSRSVATRRRADRLPRPDVPLLHQGPRSARRTASRWSTSCRSRRSTRSSIRSRGRSAPGCSVASCPTQRNALDEEYVWRIARRRRPGRRAVVARARLRLRRRDVDYSPALEEDHAIGPRRAASASSPARRATAGARISSPPSRASSLGDISTVVSRRPRAAASR